VLFISDHSNIKKFQKIMFPASGLGKGKLQKPTSSKKKRGEMANERALQDLRKFGEDATEVVRTARNFCESTIEPIVIKLEVIPYPDNRGDPEGIYNHQKVMKIIGENQYMVAMTSMKIWEWLRKRGEYFLEYQSHKQRMNNMTTLTTVDTLKVIIQLKQIRAIKILDYFTLKNFHQILSI